MAQSYNPVPIQTPIVSGKNGLISNSWANFFLQMLNGIQNTALSNPMTALGDLIFGGNGGSPARLPGNNTSTQLFLTQTGNGSSSAPPVWSPIIAANIPTLNQNTTGSAGSLSQALLQDAIILGNTNGVTAMASLGTAGQAFVSQGPGLIPIWQTVGGYTMFGTRSKPVLIAAADGITPNAVQRQRIRIAGNGGAVTITATDAIGAGSVDGQELVLEGSSASKTVTINDGSGLEQGGMMELGTGDKIAYSWNSDAGVWTEDWRFYSGITGGILTDDDGNALTDGSGNPLTDG